MSMGRLFFNVNRLLMHAIHVKQITLLALKTYTPAHSCIDFSLNLSACSNPILGPRCLVFFLLFLFILLMLIF